MPYWQTPHTVLITRSLRRTVKLVMIPIQNPNGRVQNKSSEKKSEKNGQMTIKRKTYARVAWVVGTYSMFMFFLRTISDLQDLMNV